MVVNPSRSQGATVFIVRNTSLPDASVKVAPHPPAAPGLPTLPDRLSPESMSGLRRFLRS